MKTKQNKNNLRTKYRFLKKGKHKAHNDRKLYFLGSKVGKVHQTAERGKITAALHFSRDSRGVMNVNCYITLPREAFMATTGL